MWVDFIRVTQTNRWLPTNRNTRVENRPVCALLEYYAALSGSSVPTFRNRLLFPSSRVKKSSGNDRFSRKVFTELPRYAASSRRREQISIWRCKPEITQGCNCFWHSFSPSGFMQSRLFCDISAVCVWFEFWRLITCSILRVYRRNSQRRETLKHNNSNSLYPHQQFPIDPWFRLAMFSYKQTLRFVGDCCTSARILRRQRLEGLVHDRIWRRRKNKTKNDKDDN
jgi:hypothetical protein